MPLLFPQINNFLLRLTKNNNRLWFTEHKEEFLALHKQFKSFAHEFAESIATFDPLVANALGDPKTIKIFRIYRDVRFSKNKLPYKNNFGIKIVPHGTKDGAPCYYLHIQPGASFLAGGSHMPDKQRLDATREKISTGTKGLKKILSNPEFKSLWGSLDTYYSLKTIPRGYDKNHPEAALLRLKNYTVSHPLKDSELKKNDFLKNSIEKLKVLKPLNDWLRKSQ